MGHFLQIFHRKGGIAHQPLLVSQNQSDCRFVWYENICNASFSFVTINASDKETDGWTELREQYCALHYMQSPGKTRTARPTLLVKITHQKRPWRCIFQSSWLSLTFSDRLAKLVYLHDRWSAGDMKRGRQNSLWNQRHHVRDHRLKHTTSITSNVTGRHRRPKHKCTFVTQCRSVE